jgi:hypothetical protein
VVIEDATWQHSFTSKQEKTCVKKVFIVLVIARAWYKFVEDALL